MTKNIVEKVLQAHLREGGYVPGQEIAIGIDQTLVHDATGTMAFLQFEALGVGAVRTELSVTYIDHNTQQIGFENSDDHLYLQSVSAKFGAVYSRAGNGICHQVHLERFGKPGTTLLGADSHTPTGGGMGQIAVGAGGLDVAVAMGGGPFHLTCPKVYQVRLSGRLREWVSAKDVVLHMLSILTTKGNVGVVLEYGGEGVEGLGVPERATIANMGAEMGVTTSIFPSDDVTRRFLRAQGREKDWAELTADPGARYDRVIEVDLSALEPLVAAPHSPGNVVKLSAVEGTPADQVCIGSCTNSSYRDMMTAAAMLKGRTIAPGVSLGIAPGSRQILRTLARQRRAERPHRRGGAHPGKRLRVLRGGALLAQERRRVGPDLEPQFRGPLRHPGRAGLSLQPGSGRRRRDHGSADVAGAPGHPLPEDRRSRTLIASTTACSFSPTGRQRTPRSSAGPTSASPRAANR